MSPGFSTGGTGPSTVKSIVVTDNTMTHGVRGGQVPEGPRVFGDGRRVGKDLMIGFMIS